MPGAEQAPAVRVVLSTCPPDRAVALAGQLVEERLAACANVVPGLLSIYRWEGEVCRDGESLIILKCPTSSLESLRRRLVELHPYDLPSFVVIPVEGGHAPYLSWAAAAGETES